jgi:hypothetical protein
MDQAITTYGSSAFIKTFLENMPLDNLENLELVTKEYEMALTHFHNSLHIDNFSVLPVNPTNPDTENATADSNDFADSFFADV